MTNKLGYFNALKDTYSALATHILCSKYSQTILWRGVGGYVFTNN